MGASQTVQVTQDQRVAHVRVYRPNAANALDRQTLDSLLAELSAVSASPDIDIVVLTGTDPYFSCGGDQGMARAWQDMGSDEREASIRSTFEAVASILELVEGGPKTYIARVNGLAYAGGFILATACDYVIASENARFRLPETAGGQIDPFSPVRLPYQIGRLKAKELLLFANEISAAEACEYGLVSEVVPHADLDEAVARAISRLRITSPSARAATKAVMMRAAAPYFIEPAVAHSMSPDAAEGVNAFLAKRRPAWQSAER